MSNKKKYKIINRNDIAFQDDKQEEIEWLQTKEAGDLYEKYLNS